MKRISISALMLLIAAAGAAEARPLRGYYGFGYSSSRDRTRWSIYAHGLVSGVVYYSPYATGPTGLVEGYLRYSPYAFGHDHSGLVYDDGGGYGYGYSPVYHNVIHHYVPTDQNCKLSGSSESDGSGYQSRAPKRRRETLEERKARRAALAKARQKTEAIRANDGKVIITEYLRENDIPFRTTRILSIEGRTVSVDFLLNAGKTIIKFWDPAEIPSEGRLQQRKRKFFDRYVESWKVARDEHLQDGGSIHQIISSDREEILAKLPQCPDLNGIETVYASAQSETVSAETQQ